jgi:hypothetical protein
LQVDVDLALGAADQVDRADAAHVFQALLQHLVGPVGQLHRLTARRRLGCHRQHRQRPDRRAGRVEAQHARLLDLGAQQFGRTSATFSRTSSAALRPSMCSWNSMMTTDCLRSCARSAR